MSILEAALAVWLGLTIFVIAPFILVWLWFISLALADKIIARFAKNRR